MYELVVMSSAFASRDYERAAAALGEAISLTDNAPLPPIFNRLGRGC
jgi:hypothetical protein